MAARDCAQRQLGQGNYLDPGAWGTTLQSLPHITVSRGPRCNGVSVAGNIVNYHAKITQHVPLLVCGPGDGAGPHIRSRVFAAATQSREIYRETAYAAG